MKKITVIVSPTGETTIKTTGFVGEECRRASRSLEQSLGQPTKEVRTAEYYQSVPVLAVHAESDSAA